MRSLIDIWDFWIYKQFRKSAKRISKNVSAFPYFVKLEMEDISNKNNISESLKRSTESFYTALKEHVERHNLSDFSEEHNFENPCADNSELKTFHDWLNYENSLRTDNPIGLEKAPKDFRTSEISYGEFKKLLAM